MKFGKPLTKPPKPRSKAMLPSREAVAQLTKGGPGAQSISNYAKLTPSGATAMATPYGNIEQMGEAGASAEPEQ